MATLGNAEVLHLAVVRALSTTDEEIQGLVSSTSEAMSFPPDIASYRKLLKPRNYEQERRYWS
jgi:hypothetical protein